MKTRWLQLTLESDVIFSASGASAGAHRTLAHIPGASIRGAAAAVLHSSSSPWEKPEIWSVFHSGRVRFLPGYPVSDKNKTGNENKSLSFPVPLSLRRMRKDIPLKFSGKIDARFVFNLAAAEDSSPAGHSAIGAGFVIDDDTLYTPQTGLTLKSSTLSRRGGSNTGLFTYEALCEGQVFYSSIQADDCIDDHYLDKLCSELTANPVRLGKSRRKEFGAVRIDSVEIDGQLMPVADQAALGAVVVYAYTDLALRALATGLPTLTPSPVHFGLPEESVYLPDRSWLDTRQYSPFNLFRKAADPERHVISLGSVMVFKLPAEINWTDLRRQLQSGVGDYRHDGLGQVMLQPEMLISRSPKIVKGAVLPGVAVTEIELPDSSSELAGWLCSTRADRDEQLAAASLAEIWCSELRKFTGPDIPGASQWSEVRRLAMTVDSGDALMDQLFAEPGTDNSDKGGLLRRGVSKRMWATSRYNTSRRERMSLFGTLQLRMDRTDSTRLARLALQLTAARMASHTAGRNL